MAYTIKDISAIIGEDEALAEPSHSIEHLLTDSRRLIFPSATLFFALQTTHKSGEDFVEELHHAGVRNFVVSKHFDATRFKKANFIKVENTLLALQLLAAHHRRQFNIPVIGITGSNGKTIVKEWLYQLLNEEYNIARSPKSYNSQIGVPLSVWQLNNANTLAIFEAGISLPGEMDALEKIIQPTIGILTNIGAAHAASFESKEKKLEEKWKLFSNAVTLTCNHDDDVIVSFIAKEKRDKLFTWGKQDADLHILSIQKRTASTLIEGFYNQKKISIPIPFTDDASVENAITCWAVMLLLKMDDELIVEKMKQLQPVEMRLQLKKALNNCSIINDSYSNDLSSLKIALNFLHQQSGRQPTSVILSDLGESSGSYEQYEGVLHALVEHKIDKFIGIGTHLNDLRAGFEKWFPASFFYTSTEDFISHFGGVRFKDETILLKGARRFHFEDISLLFEQKVHQTVLDVNLTAMVHNLKEYQRRLKPSTKIMAMVKAFSYGSGSAEVANVLQFNKVDYLAVAYADEGVELRRSGINMPIMVMNPETITFQSLIEYNLEPEMYSFGILQAFNNYLLNAGIVQFPVHIKIDTGMHRLGFEEKDLFALRLFIIENPGLVIKSVFSHMVASDEQAHDSFSQTQVNQFVKACDAIETATNYPFIRHITNSAGILRHPEFQFDMVRLGIGLYGVDSSTTSKLNLLPVATLRSTIAQVRQVKKDETIGYSRKGRLQRDSIIATVRIGYADGFNRLLGNGVGKILVRGQLANVVGNVCMDMTMLDVTDISGVKEGDVVEIFGANLPVQQVAAWSETISYEVMTGINQRVKREYYEE